MCINQQRAHFESFTHSFKSVCSSSLLYKEIVLLQPLKCFSIFFSSSSSSPSFSWSYNQLFLEWLKLWPFIASVVLKFKWVWWLIFQAYFFSLWNFFLCSFFLYHSNLIHPPTDNKLFHSVSSHFHDLLDTFANWKMRQSSFNIKHFNILTFFSVWIH